MNKSRTRAVGLIALAIVLACIAGFIALSLIQSANDETEAVRKQYGDQVYVIVVAKDIPARSIISLNGLNDGTLKIEKRPKLYVPNSAFTVHDPNDAIAVSSLSENITGYTLIPLRAGDILLPTMIENTYIVPPGMRAISIAVSNVTSISGYVRSGDRVDVIASYELEQTGGGASQKYQRTMVLLQNVSVLAVSWFNNMGITSDLEPTSGLTTTVLSSMGSSPQEVLQASQKRDTVVTLAVPIEDAAKLTFMENFGKELRLVLRRQDDTRVAPVPTVAPDQYIPR